MFEEKLANNINYSTKVEVCSTYNLIYDGVQYLNNEKIYYLYELKKIISALFEGEKTGLIHGDLHFIFWLMKIMRCQ